MKRAAQWALAATTRSSLAAGSGSIWLRLGVEAGPTVGEQGVFAIQALVPRPLQVADRRQQDRTVLQDGPGQRVTVRTDDQRAADPGHAALVPTEVCDRDDD